MNKKGFTLIEILAVIIILGLIILLVVSRLSNTIYKNQEKLYKEQKKRLEEAAIRYINEQYVPTTQKYRIIMKRELQTAGYIEEIYDIYDDSKTCSAFVVFTNMDISPKVTSYIDCNNNIEEMATYTIASSGNMKADDTIDANLRYSGGDGEVVTTDDVPNYVTFNGEKWRIIGIFNVSNGTIIEPRIKIIRNESLGSYSWDTSPSTYNSGYGYNIWETINDKTKTDGTTKADVNRLLNELYLGEENQHNPVICYNGQNGDATANPQVGVTNCPEERLNITAKEMIEDAVWNLGGISTNAISPLAAYIAERGTNVNNSTITKTEWTGKVGLIYPSDYGYANDNIVSYCSLLNLTTCKTNNWLNIASSYHTLSPNSIYIGNAFTVHSTENILYRLRVYNALGVRPVVYLSSAIKIATGTGTYENPYQLSF